MIDTHCHLDKAEFDGDRAAVLERARVAGVTDVVVPAVGPPWDGLLSMARSTPGVHAGLGVHPQLLPELDACDDDRLLSDLESALARSGAVAVGECGLDGPSSQGAKLERQRWLLASHLALARRFSLPVVLHCLRAHEPMLELLEREPLPAGGVLHSYSGGPELVPRYARLGLHFSFAGPVTFGKARRPLEAVRAVPPDRLLLETDAPDQTPRPHRGRNEPAFLPGIAAAVARALGTTAEAVDALTSQNARRLFRLR